MPFIVLAIFCYWLVIVIALSEPRPTVLSAARALRTDDRGRQLWERTVQRYDESDADVTRVWSRR